MIAVTGAAGFIGGRIALALHERGHEVLGIDHAEVPDPAALALASTLDPAGFLGHIEDGARHIEVVIHQGACVDTTFREWARMNAANVEYPSRLLRACLRHRIPFIYASSAAVYGTRPGEERPLNEYGRSKLVFDRTVRLLLPRARSPIVGLRYFNVYGRGEAHKGAMASIVFQLVQQLKRGEPLRLFCGSDGYADGEQRRDFVTVEDVVDVNLWFLERRHPSGIYDVGTGTSVTFNRIAELILSTGGGTIEYVPMPQHLRGRYQSFTKADPARLRRVGFVSNLTTVGEGIPRYLASLAAHGSA